MTKAIVEKPTFLNFVFFVKHFRQQLVFSQYGPSCCANTTEPSDTQGRAVVSSLCHPPPPPLKNPGYAPDSTDFLNPFSLWE